MLVGVLSVYCESRGSPTLLVQSIAYCSALANPNCLDYVNAFVLYLQHFNCPRVRWSECFDHHAQSGWVGLWGLFECRMSVAGKRNQSHLCDCGQHCIDRHLCASLYQLPIGLELEASAACA
jgi:hypothetical protein